MEKSMYSLILMDEVVGRIDDLARRRGQSRSGFINRILADYVSLVTPEKRIEAIFAAIEEEVSGSGILPAQSSVWMLQLKSVLQYRYHPALRYSVEFSLEDGRCRCELRVSSRSQNDVFLSRLTVFYEIWSQIELTQLAGRLPGELRHSIKGGRFRRSLAVGWGEDSDPRTLGAAIGKYILLLDRALRMSFSAEHGVDMTTFEAMNRLYRDHLETGAVL